jgi:hypothetical protein
MSSPGLELLVRLVVEELGGRQCARCAGSLSGSRVMIREHGAEKVVIEVRCRACDEALVLKVEPSGEGVAGIE